jgi:hypothetical protein
MGEEDFAHAALAEFADDLVVAQPLAVDHRTSIMNEDKGGNKLTDVTQLG